MQLTSESSSLGSSYTLGQLHKKLRNLKSTQTNHKEGRMNWQNKLRIFYKNIKSRKDANTSEKKCWRKVLKTCTSTPLLHLRRWWWISSVLPVTLCFLFGICDHLEKISKDDLESRPNGSAADNPSNYDWTAEENLSARASTVESDGTANSASAAEENFQIIPSKETTEAVVERANVTKDKELVRLCKNADYAEILKIGRYLQTRPARNRTGKLCTRCEEFDKPTSSISGRVLRRTNPASRIGQIKDRTIFDKEGCSGIDVKVPSTNNSETLVWVNACTAEVRNCRPIAATNCIILKKIKTMRHERAQGNLRQKASHCEQRETWSKNIWQFTK